MSWKLEKCRKVGRRKEVKSKVEKHEDNQDYLEKIRIRVRGQVGSALNLLSCFGLVQKLCSDSCSLLVLA